MKAITVEPRTSGTARLEDVPNPEVRDGSVLVEAIAVGVCGTDVEIAQGDYGWAPPGKSRLVLGHESLGRVIDAGPASSLKEGDLVGGTYHSGAVSDVGFEPDVVVECTGVGQVIADSLQAVARALERKPDDIKVVVQFAEA